MANRIYPAALPRPNTPLGYDGTDFRAMKQDIVSNTDPSLRVSLPCDRDPVTLLLSYAAAQAAHAWTERATYTIPAQKKAVLSLGYLALSGVPATSLASIILELNATTLFQITAISSTLLDILTRSWPCAIWLVAGDIVSIDTYNGSATSLGFYGTAMLSVFDG